MLQVNELVRNFIDLVYPLRCRICRNFTAADGSMPRIVSVHFCPACVDSFKPICSPLCPVCGRPFTDSGGEDHLCGNCLRRSPFYDALRAPYLYEGPLMEAIHQFKYGGKAYLGDSLGELLSSYAANWPGTRADLLVMPVPLHPKRLRERGFNQSLILARHVASVIGAELDFLSLRRIRFTQPQAGLKSDERRKNIRKAFELARGSMLKGRTIVLVDDVSTTGNTLNECSRVLKRAGCKGVYCLVLARTEGH